MTEPDESPLVDADVADDARGAVRIALLRAIEKAGTQQKLVDLIGEGVERGHLSYWLKQGMVPEKHCAVIEQGTGVSRRALCPAWRRVWPELLAVADQQGA
jgi:DNA-binding transcriptional regulator YdaS (Cro superfamily)